MLRISNIYKKYEQDFVLQDFSLEVKEAESIAIIGASGSGKSTLLNTIAGIDSIDSGEIIFNNQDITKLNEKQKTKFRGDNLGFIYQFHHLLLDFNVLENVCMPLFIQKIDKNQAISKAKDVLKQVGLEHKIHSLPSELSGGQRQRVAIARALIAKPKLILADEPTGNLDRENANNIMNILLDLQQQYGSSLIIATHDENLAQKTNKIININNP